MEKKKNKMQLGEKDYRILIATSSITSLVLAGCIGLSIGLALTNLTPYEKQLLEVFRTLKEDWLYSYNYDDIDSVVTNMMLSGLNDNSEDPYVGFDTFANLGLDTTPVEKSWGFSYTIVENGIYVSQVEEGYTKNVLSVGDIINGYKIDNKNVNLSDFSSAIEFKDALLNDVKETTSNSFIVRKTDNSEVTLKKDYYSTSVCTGSYVNVNSKKVALIRVDTFLSTPYSCVTSFLDQTIQKNGNLDLVVFDLTNNTGGYVDEATNLAAEFLNKDTFIFKGINNKNEIVRKAVTKKDGKYVDTIKNVKIIGNSLTASASELFSQALIGNKKATIYGSKTYGKGIAQALITMLDNNCFKYTIYESKFPNYDENNNYTTDYSIHNIGIYPSSENTFINYNDFSFFSYNPTTYTNINVQNKFINYYPYFSNSQKDFVGKYFEDYLYQFLVDENLTDQYNSSHPYLGVKLNETILLRINQRIAELKEDLKQTNIEFMINS